MVEIKTLFNISSSTINNYLLEKGFDNRFLFKHKFYYSVVRPFIPKRIRLFIQERINKKIKYNNYFIWEELVEIVVNNQYITQDKEQKTYDDKLKTGTFTLNWTSFKYPGEKDCAIVLTHDVEEQSGFNFIPKVIELEEKYGFKSSWNIIPYKYKIDEGIINLIKQNGHEIGIHGYNHDGKLYYSEKIFNERVPYINEALKKFDAVGFRSPQVHRNLKWLQKLNILYDASCFDYDPFQPFPGGTGSIWPFIVGKFVELPYTLPQDHTIFYILKQKNIKIWEKKAEWIAKNKGVILSITHPDYLMDRNNLSLYEELLKYFKSFDNSWFCLPREMAVWCKKIIEKSY